MIQKINTGISVVKSPIRKNLTKIGSNLKNLNGSSMSGGLPPHIYEVTMIIPGGLTLKEKAYYILSGKIPSSVYKRWYQQTENVLPKEGDQVVTMDKVYDSCIANSARNLHDYHQGDVVSTDSPIEPIQFNNDDAVSSIVGTEVNTDAGTSGTDDGTLSLTEIWTHLSGFAH